MDVASLFAKELNIAINDLDNDEWAVTRAREKVIQNLSPPEAFNSVVGVLSLAAAQSDTYAFSSCCWLAVSLAELSSTTERPENLDVAISNAILTGRKLNAESELKPLLKWYRYDT